jgi:hypothetical protein
MTHEKTTASQVSVVATRVFRRNFMSPPKNGERVGASGVAAHAEWKQGECLVCQMP